MIGRNSCTVLLVWNEWSTEQSQLRRRCTGAVRKTKDREKLFKVNAFSHRFSTSRSMVQEWLATTEQQLFLRSVYCRISSFTVLSTALHVVTDSKHRGWGPLSYLVAVDRRTSESCGRYLRIKSSQVYLLAMVKIIHVHQRITIHPREKFGCL